MLSIPSHLKNARLIDTHFGNITKDHLYLLELEYRKTGNIKASSLIPKKLKDKRHTSKKEARSSRLNTTLADFEMWKRDINYITSELANIGSMRSNKSVFTQSTVSYAIETASKVTKCLNHASLITNNRKGTHRVKPFFRCKNYACPYCTYLKLRTRQNNFSSGLTSKHIELDYKFSTLATISFVDKASSTDEIKEQLKSLNKATSQILGYNHIRKNISGTARSIEVIEDEKTKGNAHVHLHMLLLFKNFKGMTKTQFKSYLTKKLNKPVRVHYSDSILHKHDKDHKELTKGFNYLNKTFGLKTKDTFSTHHITHRHSSSSITKQTSLFYLKMLPAIKSQRLFNTTGIIKQILKEGKLINQLNKQDHSTPTNHSIHIHWQPLPYKDYDKKLEIYRHKDLGEYYVDKREIEYFIRSLDTLGIHTRAKILKSNNLTSTDSCKLTLNRPLINTPTKEPFPPDAQTSLFTEDH